MQLLKTLFILSYISGAVEYKILFECMLFVYNTNYYYYSDHGCTQLTILCLFSSFTR